MRHALPNVHRRGTSLTVSSLGILQRVVKQDFARSHMNLRRGKVTKRTVQRRGGWLTWILCAQICEVKSLRSLARQKRILFRFAFVACS